jgi:hypothetical protein
MTGLTDDLLDPTASDDVERRLRAALRTRARDLRVTDEVFDPDRPGILTEPEPTARPAAGGRRGPIRRSGHAGRSRGIAVAAAAAVALGGLVWRGAGGTGVEPGGSFGVVPQGASVPSSPPPPAPTPLGPGLMATWLPPRYTVVDVQVTPYPAGSDPAVPVSQTLVPEPGGPGRSVLLDIQPGDGGFGDGEPVTVNGHPGITRPSKDTGDYDVIWNEGGSSISASVTGLDRASALDLLATLHWAGDHRRVASVGAPGWRLESDPVGGDNVGVTAVYGDAAAHRLIVQTNTFEAGRYGYTGLKLRGTAQADGSVVVVDRFDPARPTVMVAWPDGRTASVVGTGLDDDTMTRIALSIRLTGDAELRAQRAEGWAHMAEQPRLSTMTVPAGTVTVVGQDSPAGVCLTLTGHDPVCAARSFDHNDRISAGVLIDGRPYAVAATVQGAVSARYGFVLVSSSKAWDGSPIERATGDGWQVLVTAPPGDDYRDIGVGSVADGRVTSSSSIPWAER